MGGCSIFHECPWLPYSAIAGGKLSDQINHYGCQFETKRGGKNGTNNLSVQGPTDFANIIEVESQSALLSVKQSI